MRALLMFIAVLSLSACTTESETWLQRGKTIGGSPSSLRYYPRAAFDAGVEGQARVRCEAGENNYVRLCHVAEETPPGYGFGESAISFIQGKQLVGLPPLRPGAVVVLPMKFALPNKASAGRRGDGR